MGLVPDSRLSAIARLYRCNSAAILEFIHYHFANGSSRAEDDRFEFSAGLLKQYPEMKPSHTLTV